MVVGRAEAVGAVRDVGQAQAFVVGDEGAQDASARRAGPDGVLLLVGQAHGDELVQRAAVLAQHAQRAVLGVDQDAGLLNEPTQDHGQVQLGVEDHDGLEQATQLGGILNAVEGLHGVQATGGGGPLSGAWPHRLRRRARGPERRGALSVRACGRVP